MNHHCQWSATTYLDHKVCVSSRKGILSLRQELVFNRDLENADVVVSDFFALLLGCVLIIVLVPEDVVAGVEGFVVVVVVACGDVLY